MLLFPSLREVIFLFILFSFVFAHLVLTCVPLIAIRFNAAIALFARASHAAPAPVEEYVSAFSAVYAASVPGMEYNSPAPAVSYAASIPKNYAAPGPLVEHCGVAPVVSYAAPAPVQNAPTLQHAVPVLWPVSTTTGTRGGNQQGWPSRCAPETSGWGCCAADFLL